MTKAEQINFALVKVSEILNIIRPNDWAVKYIKVEDVNSLGLSEYQKSYYGIVSGEEYFMVYISNQLRYVVNVTGDNVMTSLQELIDVLAKKF